MGSTNFTFTFKFFISNDLVKHTQVKLSDGKERRFGDIVTPFSSSNAIE